MSLRLLLAIGVFFVICFEGGTHWLDVGEMRSSSRRGDSLAAIHAKIVAA